ncbi:eukaryotic translation initiation factor 5A-2 [Olea europaea subsp. europaea]|uniref:Eukaryotic translation initiation factor 5A-2 n=2 Tax=Olea europaea subsp. europaea TaxID=158383 RepID=A0A8S0PRA4_OLEEU|nr:eukaryotic translation initiation factor 5A-2 [Olea europaea subsp. europaea]
MSDEEHHFESKADAGASKTYPQQAGTIRKNGYIVIKGRPCKVVEVSTSKTGKHGHAKCHFVAIDIFTAKKLEDIVPSSHNCDVPHVNRTDYQLIDISEDGFVSLLTENGNTKDDLRLPTDDNLLTQIKDGFAEGKDLVVSVMSAMGEEQICGLKDIGPKRFCNCQGCLCFEYDHIVPFSKGGESVAENCQILLTKVNRFKANKEEVDTAELKGYYCDVNFTDKELDIIEMAVYGDVIHPGNHCRCMTVAEMFVQSDSVLGDFRDKSNCSDKVTEFSCACLLCLCCPLSMVWCCVKTSCKKGRCLAVKAMHRACCRLDKRIYAEYSSFSDIDTDYQASKRHMLSEIPVPVKNR